MQTGRATACRHTSPFSCFIRARRTVRTQGLSDRYRTFASPKLCFSLSTLESISTDVIRSTASF